MLSRGVRIEPGPRLTVRCGHSLTTNCVLNAGLGLVLCWVSPLQLPCGSVHSSVL